MTRTTSIPSRCFRGTDPRSTPSDRGRIESFAAGKDSLAVIGMIPSPVTPAVSVSRAEHVAHRGVRSPRLYAATLHEIGEIADTNHHPGSCHHLKTLTALMSAHGGLDVVTPIP
jgi:hypothetical protein